tara:strand:+ start:1977 stop:2960 length:984 start_codon:yes stop_codon:yes gene_type:complete
MADLEGKMIASTYRSILNVGTSNNQELDGTLRVIEDGAGNDSALSLATDSALISGNGTRLYFYDADGGEHISANNSGHLSLAAGSEIDITATTIDINGALVLSGNITMADDTSIGISDSDERIEFDGAGDITFLGCNVGINEGAPSYKLDITASEASGYAARITNSQGSAGAGGLIIAAGKSTSVDTNGDIVWILLDDGDGTDIAKLQYLHSNDADLVTASDERLKENIKDTSIDGLSAINSLKFREFNWTVNSKRGQSKVDIGLVAQEVEATGDKCSLVTVFEKKRELKDGAEIEDVKGVSKNGILLYLAKAVQELSAKVTALESA